MLTGHALSADVDKQRLFIRRRNHLRTNKLNVLRERDHCLGIKRNGAGFILAAAVNHRSGQIHIGDLQIDQLADANARCIQQLQHRTITVALHIHALRLLQKQLHFLAGEDLRKLLRSLIRHQLSGRNLIDPALISHILIEIFQRSDCTGHCCD